MITNILLDEISTESIFIVDDDGNPVENLQSSDFLIKLFNPSGEEVHLTVLVMITELQLGVYRINFIPNQLGLWTLVLYNPTWFPTGKVYDYECIEVQASDLSSIVASINEIKTALLEIYALYGLDPTKPLVVTPTFRQAGTIFQKITSKTKETRVQRQS